MEKQYVVKNFLTNQYWSFDSKWGNQFEAREFNPLPIAKLFITASDEKVFVPAPIVCDNVVITPPKVALAGCKLKTPTVNVAPLALGIMPIADKAE